MELPHNVSAAVVPTRHWRAPGYDCRGPSQVTWMIYSRQVSGKILTVYKYYDGREDRYMLFLSLILFRLVAPPL
jgi:hypothetical protein